jgi:hypothetical protein
LNSAQFLDILQRADSLELSEIEQLHKLQGNFPYFQIPYVLLARDEFQKNIPEKSSSLAFAAITSPDRIWLKTLVEKKGETVVQGEDALVETTKGSEKVSFDDEKRLIEVITAITKKEVKLESIKEIEAIQHAQNLDPIKYNLSAASMRLTIVFEVDYRSPSNDEEILKRTLTFFKDYDPRTTTFLKLETEMVAEIYKIIQDIFTTTVANSNFTYIKDKKTILVNASQFLEIIQKADSLDRAHLQQLLKVQENFPYFQIPHVLTARYEFLTNSSQIPLALGYAAITSPNRIWLKTLIEKSDEKVASAEIVTPKAEVKPEEQPELNSASIPTKAAPEVVKPKPTRRKPPKDDLIETIKLKEKKEILSEKNRAQIDLIKAFSKKSIKLATIKEIEANQNTENLAAASTKINDNLVSESYAAILANQGKKQLAKEIYEKLVLKFPDKRAYFADLIEKLKD